MYELRPGAAGADLIPGDPESLAELAAKLGGFAAGLGEAAGRLRSIHAGDWRGPAGDAFRALIGDQPAKFDRAAAAFASARRAIDGYSETLRQAQADAARASALLASAQSGPPDAPEAADPQAQSAALRMFADARARVDVAAAGTRTALLAAAGDAPDKPSFLHRAVSAVAHAFSDVCSGFYHRVQAGAREFDSLTIALLYDPEQFERSWRAFGYGLTHEGLATFLASELDVDDWGSHPFRAFGETLANGLFPLGGLVLAMEAAPGAPSVSAPPTRRGRPARRDHGGEGLRHIPVPLDALDHSVDDPIVIDGARIYRGLTAAAAFSQRTYSTEFKSQGRFRDMTQRDVVRKLRAGELAPIDVPVSVVVKDGHTLIDNTRSAMALTVAGVPRSDWVVRDVSASGKAQADIAARLKTNGLTSAGISSVVVGPSPRSKGWKKMFPHLTPSGFRWPVGRGTGGPRATVAVNPRILVNEGRAHVVGSPA